MATICDSACRKTWSIARFFCEHGRPLSLAEGAAFVYRWPHDMASVEGAPPNYDGSDIGRTIKVWWSKHGTYFAGVVAAFDPESRRHTVRYDDGDVRDYLLEEKKFVLAPAARQAAGQAASTVASTRPIPSPASAPSNTVAASTIDISAPASTAAAMALARSFVPLPEARLSFDLSIHSLDCMGAFCGAGGLDALMGRLERAGARAEPGHALTLDGVRLLLALATALRPRLAPRPLRDLAWAVKEGLPPSLLQLDDLKGLTRNDLAALLAAFQDVVLESGHEAGPRAAPVTAAAHAVRHSVEQLRLDLSFNLLAASSLETRSS